MREPFSIWLSIAQWNKCTVLQVSGYYGEIARSLTTAIHYPLFANLKIIVQEKGFALNDEIVAETEAYFLPFFFISFHLLDTFNYRDMLSRIKSLYILHNRYYFHTKVSKFIN